MLAMIPQLDVGNLAWRFQDLQPVRGFIAELVANRIPFANEATPIL